MECHLSTLAKNRSALEEDFRKLKIEIKLPCKFKFSFHIIENYSLEGVIAAAYYWIKEIDANIVRIEFNDRFFNEYQYEQRKFTILHELIHACQRTDSMRSCNKTWIDLGLKYQSIIENTDWSGYELGEQIAINKKVLIFNTFSYIFEIWDEIFFTKNYHNFSKERLKILYDISFSAFNVNGYDSALYEITKYQVFSEIIRSFFLKKISDETFSTKFSDICKGWIDKLESITSRDEFENVMAFLEPLTDFSQYPDYTNLEKQYLRYAEYLWEH